MGKMSGGLGMRNKGMRPRDFFFFFFLKRKGLDSKTLILALL